MTQPIFVHPGYVLYRTPLTALIVYFSFWRFCGGLTYGPTATRLYASGVCQKMFADGRNVPLPRRLAPDPSVPPTRPARSRLSTRAHQCKRSPRTKMSKHEAGADHGEGEEDGEEDPPDAARALRGRPRSAQGLHRTARVFPASRACYDRSTHRAASTRRHGSHTRSSSRHACATGIPQWIALFLAGDTPTPTLPAVSRNNNNNNGAGAGAEAGRGAGKGKE